MRKTVATVTTALLVTLGVIGPVRPAGTEAMDDRITCGAGAPPACELLAQVDALLAPLQPVLAVGGPLLGELGPAIGSLAALSGQASSAQGAPIADLRGAADAVLDQVEAVAQPLGQLLGAGTVVTGLTSSLRDLVAALASAVGGDAPAEGAAATPAPLPAPGSGGTIAGASTDSTAFGAPLAFGADAGVVGRAGAPDVPAGSALSLAPLALPDFGLVTTPHATAKELATEAAAKQLTSELVLPAASQVADRAPAPDSTRALQVLGALSVLLLAAGLATDRIRKTRHVIPS